MRRPGFVSAGLAPVALIGGWSLAQVRQPPGYDAVRDTISALAASPAHDRWIMTTGLGLLGACHIVTAASLTEATALARALLATGGVATIVVAAAPQPAAAHVPAAAVGFIALAIWPAWSGVPSRTSSRVATAVLVVLLGWLGLQLHHGGLLGLSERAVAGAEALWPLVVVVSLTRRQLPRGQATIT
jgi:hypothetical membrane protein